MEHAHTHPHSTQPHTDCPRSQLKHKDPCLESLRWDGTHTHIPKQCRHTQYHSQAPTHSNTTDYYSLLPDTFYMYEVSLVLVWRGWEVAIISYSMSPVRNHDKILRPSHPFYSDGMVWCCGIMTTIHGWRLLNTLYRYEVNLVRVWRGWEVAIISYSMSPVRNPHRILPQAAHPFRVMVWYGVVALWLPAMVEGFQTLSMGIMMKCIKSEVVPSLNLVMVAWFVPR
jgi:hypothetical protein